MKYEAYLLFRKSIDGNKLVYVHPYAVVSEYCLEVVQMPRNNWWGVNESTDLKQDLESENLSAPVQLG